MFDKIFSKFVLIIAILSAIFAVVCSMVLGAKFGTYFFLTLAIVIFIYTISNNMYTNYNWFNTLLKIYRKLFKLLFILWIISFIIVEGLIISGTKNDDVLADTIIVLGAGIINNAPSQTLALRLDTAFDYLTKNQNTKVILTGGIGKGESLSESYVSRKYLTDKGIDSSRILIEESSFNTFQNIKNAKRLLGDDYNGVVACVSSDFHLYRARQLLLSNGLTPYAFGAKLEYPLLNTTYYIREYFSVMKNFLFER